MLKHGLIALAGAALLGGCTADKQVQDKLAAQRSAKLAERLSGYTAGKPESCIDTRRMRATRIIDDTAIIYEESNRKLWVNQPPGGCSSLRENRTLVTRTPTDRLCSGDIVRVIDPPTPIEFGSCGLGKFVPYTRM